MQHLKSTVFLLCLLSWNTFSEQASYQSIANELTINANGNVDVNVLNVDEEDEIFCKTDQYDFRFSLDTIVGQRWYDTLLLSRNSSSLVDFVYDQDDCELTAISLPKLYEDGSSVVSETPDGELKETGENNNVVLIGTNGLSAESYSSSSFYGQDAPEAAFDGYVYNKKGNQDANDKISRGIWMAKNVDADGEKVTPWLQVDFGKQVTLSGILIKINKQSLELGRSPKNVTLYTSNDGEEFTEETEFFLSLQESTGGDFAELVTARFFRFEVLNNYGDKMFVEIDELELFQ